MCREKWHRARAAPLWSVIPCSGLVSQSAQPGDAHLSALHRGGFFGPKPARKRAGWVEHSEPIASHNNG